MDKLAVIIFSSFLSCFAGDTTIVVDDTPFSFVAEFKLEKWKVGSFEFQTVECDSMSKSEQCIALVFLNDSGYQFRTFDTTRVDTVLNNKVFSYILPHFDIAFSQMLVCRPQRIYINSIGGIDSLTYNLGVFPPPLNIFQKNNRHRINKNSNIKNGELYFSSEVVAFSLFSMDGKKIKYGETKRPVDVRKVNSGLYMLKLVLKNGQEIQSEMYVY